MDQAWIYWVACGRCGYKEDRRVVDGEPAFGLIELHQVRRGGVTMMTGMCPLCGVEVAAGRRAAA